MFGDFFLFEREGEPPVRGERLAFGETGGRNEAWLRDTLFANPELLPVRSIDPAFGPLIPLCTELTTEAGPLDAALINPHGRLTLVECKLWRNPEARRKVVAQVLDYARAISSWSYADLQRRVAMSTARKGNVRYELVRAAAREVHEQQFVDAASSAMRNGHFLLLIAGDGIREDVGALADLINRNAASGFAFGLVEVALYGLPDGGLLIQPRTLAKTALIERNVVVIRERSRDGAEDPLVIEVAADDDPLPPTNGLGEGAKQAGYRAWWQPVLDMKFDDPEQEPPRLFYPNNVRVRLPWPKTWLLATATAARGIIGVYLIESGERANRTLLPVVEGRADELASQLPPDSAFGRGEAGVVAKTERSVDTFTSEREEKAWLIKTLNTYANVFRPVIRTLPKDASALT